MAENAPLLEGAHPEVPQHKPFKKGTDLDISQGPASHRRCTDFLFFVLLCAACAAYGFTKVLAWRSGKPALLTGAVDWQGRVCGYDAGVKDYPYLYFPTITKPGTQSPSMAPFEQLIPVCTSKCPDSFAMQRKECSGEDVAKGFCSWYGGETKLVVHRFCLFKGPNESDVKGTEFCRKDKDGKPTCSTVQQASELKALGISKFREFMHDVAEAKYALYWAPLATVVAGYMYLIAVQQCTFLFVWGGVIGVIAFPFLGGYVMYNEAQMLEVEEDKQDALFVACFCVALGTVMALLVCCFLKSIRVAIAVLEVAAKFCRDCVSSWIMPLIFALLNIALVLTWAAGFGLQLTTLRVKPIANLSQSLDRFEVADDSYYYFLAFDVFMLLWLANFIAALADMTIAGAVGYWYFTPMSADGGKHPRAPVTRALLNAFFWHGGSAAFGSLLIATLTFIRLILQAIHKAAKKQARSGDPQAAAAQMVTCCLACVLRCVESALKYVTNIAYVQVALIGKPFCESAGVAVGLWARNCVRFAMVNDLSWVISFIGMLVITQAPVATTYLLLTKHEAFANSVTNPYSATILAGVFGMLIATCIMRVYSEACEAVLQCYLADEEMAQHSGLPEAEHTPHELRKFIDVHACHKGQV